MKHNFFIGFLLCVLSSIIPLSQSIHPSLSQMIIANSTHSLNQSEADNFQSSRVIFRCKEIFDKASGKNIPATIAWIPEDKKHVRFIAWKSEYFGSRWSPKKRCEKVTENFHKYYNEGRLDYLSTGKYNGYSVICAAKPGESCNEKNHLFTIKQGQVPELVLERLLDIGEAKAGRPLYQSSGKQLYIEVQNILKYGPVVNLEN